MTKGPRGSPYSQAFRRLQAWRAAELRSRGVGVRGTLSASDNRGDESLVTGGRSVKTRGDNEGALGVLHCP